tara:strand:+ start:1174 stop:1587 length:414 start_codon:yes stop_codon:yes gene_type:complete
MANLSVTEALVTSDNSLQTYRSYETDVAITAGQVVAEDPATGNLILANATTSDLANMVGIALTSSTGAGKFIVVAERGLYVAGATLVAGTYYCVSATNGSLAPFSDLTTGQFATYAIVAETTTQARVLPYITEIAVA